MKKHTPPPRHVMTVADLIDRLREHPPELPVTVSHSGSAQALGLDVRNVIRYAVRDDTRHLDHVIVVA